MRYQERETEKYAGIEIVQEAIDDVLKNITMLDNISSEEELDQVIPQLLESLGKYSMSDRSYVFSRNTEDPDILYMTHEWCAEGVEPTIDQMQHLHLSELPDWGPRLQAGEAIVSADWNAERERTPEEYAVFDGQKINSLIVIPIFSNKRLNGYIGFDNPEQRKSTLSVRHFPCGSVD